MILAAKQGLLNLLRVLILDFHGDINKANPLVSFLLHILMLSKLSYAMTILCINRQAKRH